jgi:predicted nucleic acid-binding protein
VKHVFVETNFIIEATRPFPSPEAESLLQRQTGREIQLYVPWCSLAEAKRTVERIISEDLGFTRSMMTFASRIYMDEPTSFDKREIDKLKTLADAARAAAIRTKNARVDALAARIEVVVPSVSVVDTTLRLFHTKSLKPFDEMALGAVLSRAGELYAAGERDLYFCTLDRKDFGPSDGSALQAAYAACGLTFRPELTL